MSKKPGNQTQRSNEGANEGGGGGGGNDKGQCESCGAEKNDFNHCVHCAQKLCDNCRMKHVETLLEDFMSSREEAASLERKIHKKSIKDIQGALDNLKVSELVGQRLIQATFKDIEKQLIARKAVLMRELQVKHERQTVPLQQEKQAAEKRLYFSSVKFRDACKLSITPVRGEKASSFNKMPDGEFAQICVATTKAKESTHEFAEIKAKMEQIAAPAAVRYAYEESLDELLQKIQEFGEITVEEGKSKEDKDSKSQGKQDHPQDKKSQGKHEDNNSQKEKSNQGQDNYGQQKKAAKAK